MLCKKEGVGDHGDLLKRERELKEAQKPRGVFRRERLFPPVEGKSTALRYLFGAVGSSYPYKVQRNGKRNLAYEIT